MGIFTGGDEGWGTESWSLYCIYPRCQDMYIEVSYVLAENETAAIKRLTSTHKPANSLGCFWLASKPDGMPDQTLIISQHITVNWPRYLREKITEEMLASGLVKPVVKEGVEEGSGGESIEDLLAAYINKIFTLNDMKFGMMLAPNICREFEVHARKN